MDEEQRQEKETENLMEMLISTHEIQCTRCGAEEKLGHCDEVEAANYFYENGWKATEKHVYCAKCRKKYLKT